MVLHSGEIFYGSKEATLGDSQLKGHLSHTFQAKQKQSQVNASLHPYHKSLCHPLFRQVAPVTCEGNR